MTLDTRQSWISPIENVTASMLTTLFDTIVGFGPAAGAKHEGLDIAVPTGTPVYAPRSGTVKKVEYQAAGGNVVTLDHGGGWTSTYAHLDRALVRIGDKVKQGQEFAKSGNSGASTGPHLHWAMARNGQEVDPLDLFDPFSDLPQTAYRGSTDAIVNFLKEILKDDIGKKTWGEYTSGLFNSDWLGAPFDQFGTKISRAVRDLEWENKVIRVEDFDELAETILDVQDIDPLTSIADAFGTVSAAVGFLLKPENWARIFALVAGGVLAFVGFRVMWEATNA